MPDIQRVVIGDCTLYCGDCYTLLPDLQAETLISDPPYGIAFDFTCSKRPRSPDGLHSAPRVSHAWPDNVIGDDVPFDPRPWLHFSQIILWGAHLYAASLPRSAAWFIWDKREGMGSNKFGDAEMAWSNLPGSTRIYRHIWNGLIRRGEENGRAKLHPAQKPLALMRWCVQKTTGLVLDPFAGSFTTAHACVQLGRPCIAIEIDPHYYEIGCRRIEQATAQPPIFPVEVTSPVQQPLFAGRS